MAKKKEYQDVMEEVVDVERIKHLLLTHADNCARLAQELSTKGVKLDSHEKQLVRMATLPVIDEMTDALKSHFLTGVPYGVLSDDLACLRNFIQQFSDYKEF